MLKKSGPYSALQKKVPGNKLTLWVSLCKLQLHGCHLAPPERMQGAWGRATAKLATKREWYSP